MLAFQPTLIRIHSLMYTLEIAGSFKKTKDEKFEIKIEYLTLCQTSILETFSTKYFKFI